MIVIDISMKRKKACLTMVVAVLMPTSISLARASSAPCSSGNCQGFLAPSLSAFVAPHVIRNFHGTSSLPCPLLRGWLTGHANRKWVILWLLTLSCDLRLYIYSLLNVYYIVVSARYQLQSGPRAAYIHVFNWNLLYVFTWLLVNEERGKFSVMRPMWDYWSF